MTKAQLETFIKVGENAINLYQQSKFLAAKYIIILVLGLGTAAIGFAAPPFFVLGGIIVLYPAFHLPCLFAKLLANILMVQSLSFQVANRIREDGTVIEEGGAGNAASPAEPKQEAADNPDSAN